MDESTKEGEAPEVEATPAGVAESAPVEPLADSASHDAAPERGDAGIGPTTQSPAPATQRAGNAEASSSLPAQSFPRWWRYLGAFAISGLLIVGLSLAMGVVPGAFQAERLTTTINATTESFRFTTPEGRSSWALPAGRFSVLGTPGTERCEPKGIEALCVIDDNTQLLIDGRAAVRLQVLPAGSWSLSVENSGSEPPHVSVVDAQDRPLIETDQLLTFLPKPPTRRIRMPFIASSAVLGADLHGTTRIENSAYDLWQPVLLGGDVLIVADNRPSHEKYEVLSERLDPGDVVHIGSVEGDKDGGDQHRKDPQSIWGMLTVDTEGTEDEARPPNTVLKLVLHTSMTELTVTRFGAPEGHLIRTPFWTVLKQWPNAQSAWLFFVSIVFFLTFVIQLGDALWHGKERSRGSRGAEPTQAGEGMVKT